MESGDKDVTLNLKLLEDRVSSLERQVFGEEIRSKLQQQRKIPDELIQINTHIQRSVASKDSISKLMKKIEDVLDFLELEESSHLLGGEAKANAILAAEPLIRQMHEVVKVINIDQVQDAMNSEAIRNLTSLSNEITKIKTTQLEQQEIYENFCNRVKDIEEAVSILVSNITG